MNRISKQILTVFLCLTLTALLSTTAFATVPYGSEADYIEDETMIIIPIVTMLKEQGGLLFTTLLIGIALGVGGTLLVQYFKRRNGK